MSSHCNHVAFTPSLHKGLLDVAIVRGITGTGRIDTVHFDYVAHGVSAEQALAIGVALPLMPRVQFWNYIDDHGKIVQ